MKVDVSNRQKDLKLSKSRVRAAVKAALQELQVSFDTVAVHFVGKEEICQLHDRFFGDPSPTDCITVPIDTCSDDPMRHLGDLFICPWQALEYTKEHGGDPYEETTLYLVHTILHVIGHSDEDEEQTALMRQGERQLMTLLKQASLTLAPG